MHKNIILGTVQFGINYGINNHTGKPTDSQVFEILDTAWDNGVNTLDTADAYGEAIRIISSYHHNSNKLFKINTKFKDINEKSIITKLKSDILLLKCPKINTLFFHSYKEYEKSNHILSDLLNAKNDGLISTIGVSVYTNQELLHVINDLNIDVIQLPFNLFDNDFQRAKLLNLAKGKSKKIQVRSVFLQGLFFMNSKKLPKKLEILKPWLEKIDILSKSSDIPKESLCLLYPNAQDYVDEIIIGVDTKSQLLRNLKSLKLFLPASIKSEIDQISISPSSILYPPNWF